MEIKSLECPKCGAPIQLPEAVGATYTCLFCQNSIAVPEELRGNSSQKDLNPVLTNSEIEINLREIYTQAGMPDIQRISQWREVKQFLQDGQKIAAIKLVREITGLGLKEAKDLIEKMELGQPIEISAQSNPNSRRLDLRNQAGLEEMVRSACERGQKIEAIKLLRQATNLGLKEAKDTVEQVERGLTLDQAWNSLGFHPNLNPNSGSDLHNIEPPQGYSPPNMPKRKSHQNVINCLGCLFVWVILLFAFGVPLLMWAATSFDPITTLLQKINPVSSAKLVTQFGKEGTGPGYFSDPRAIAVDRNGSVYVADFGSGRIQRFDENGNFLNVWIIPSTTNTNDVYIRSLATDSNGQVYVVANGEINKFDGSKGEALGILMINNPSDDHSTYVDHLIVTSENRLAIVAQGESILIANSQGEVEMFIPEAMSRITKDSELSGSLAVDGLGNLFMVGAFNNAVVKYAPDGTFTTKFGGKGDEPGQLSAVLAIAADPFGQIFISDIHGISIFDGDGRFIRRFSIGATVYGIAFASDGSMWVTTNKSTVAKYTIIR